MEMKILGNRFTKINAERDLDFVGKVKSSTNVKLNSLEAVNDSKDALKMSYTFNIDFSALGKISLEGVLYFSVDAKSFKDLQKSWKDKKIAAEDYMMISNVILQKANIKRSNLKMNSAFQYIFNFLNLQIRNKYSYSNISIL